jgi:hypothetical protein
VRVLGLLLALVALVAAGCGGGSQTDEVAPVTTTPGETTPPHEASSRPKAPAIEGVSLDGGRLSLAAFRGKPVFVNVWSSW